MQFIKKFEELNMNDIGLVGGKNASLGEMIQNLTPKGITIPSGFVITADAYAHHISKNNLTEKISVLLKKVTKKDLDAFARIGHEIRSIISTAPLPSAVTTQIRAAYQAMEKQYGTQCDVAVRSSATAEDLPEASFAGQQETYLNIRGEEELIKACVNGFASLFTNRAISYRMDHGFDHMEVLISMGVQKMIRSDLASAGVAFTLDTESGFKDVIFINSAYGLGENVVKGVVIPDEFYVHKPTLEKGFKPLLKKRIGTKRTKLIYADDAKTPTVNVPVSEKQQHLFSLSDEEILELARYCITIEKYYSDKKNQWMPMDIEWGKDGKDGKLYILQARPETVHALTHEHPVLEEYVLDKKAAHTTPVIVTGKSVGRKIATGPARVIFDATDMNIVKKGDILVTDMTDPDWEPIMKRTAGIITDRGGRTCHAAIVSRELGIPAIVGTIDGSEKIQNGQMITLDCSKGEIGTIYTGKVPFEIKKVELKKIPKLPVEIMMNVGNPDEAFNLTKLPNDGIGLARLEFIINSSIQIHPMALVHPEKVTDQKVRAHINELTRRYTDKKQFFVDKLSQEAGTIAAAFYPKPVIMRLSDFKSNEYRQLIGGSFFEPVEENPMIGFRGASRYYHENYTEAFALECAAMKKMRDEMGLTNIKLMIPVVRTPDEAKLVIAKMKKYGLQQGKNNLEIYMMCEIPSNVLLIDEFSTIFDGFSIGSNDLTQMILGVDRDSHLVAPLFDERNEAVKLMLKMAIEGALRNKKKIGICGQAPSDYPEIAQFLVDCGISSISLNPDSVIKTILYLGK